MEDLVGGIFVLWIVVWIIKAILVFIYNCIVLISGNFIIIIDYLFGAWSAFPPAVSWAVMGFILGALLYFAVMESHRLNRPSVKSGIVFTCILVVIFSLTLGPESAALFARLIPQASSLWKNAVTNRIKSSPVSENIQFSSIQENVEASVMPSIRTISLVPGSDCLCNSNSGVFDAIYQGRKIFVTFAHGLNKSNSNESAVKVVSAGNEIKDGVNLLCPNSGEKKIPITGMKIDTTGIWSDQNRFEASSILLPETPRTSLRKRKASGATGNISKMPKANEK